LQPDHVVVPISGAGEGLAVAKQRLSWRLKGTPGLWDAVAWAVIAGLLMMVIAARVQAPLFSNDSYQYLSVAENLRSGNGATTSLVHFDTERATNQIPAPLTMFPPGYSVLVAAVSIVGVSVPTAALLVAMLSFMALGPLLFWGARMLHLRRMTAWGIGIALLANSSTTIYPVNILSESTFTALSTAAALCAVASRGHERPVPILLMASALAGASYGVRYAGLFIVVALISFLAAVALRRRDRSSLMALATTGVATAVVAAGMLRNHVITSSWKGGNTKHVVNPVAHLVVSTARSAEQLVLGEHVPFRAGPLQLAFVGGTGLILWLAWRYREPLRKQPSTLAFLWWYVAIYTAGLVYAGAFTVVSFVTRMFYPLLPLLLLGCGALLERVWRTAETNFAARDKTVLRVAVAIATVAYLGANVRSSLVPQQAAPHARMAAMLAEPARDGESLRAWIERNIAPNAVLVASDAQATGYVLERRVVSLTPSEQTETVWDASTVHALMARADAHYLLLWSRKDSARVPEQEESPFLMSLVRGDLPSWLELAAENDDVKVLRLALRTDLTMRTGAEPR
jgi:hypothetical protein